MEKERRINELGKLIKNMQTDISIALHHHQYEYVSHLRRNQEKYMEEMEFLQKESDSNENENIG